ncbi:GDSL-type esterase/lipase family protein [Streptomyces sp. AP-93]|uniref:GDSL-type esterase/lipase family protein n=1 Tax=Streptomyces sp. AP-93 TaxID=2929048 RepID=UPI001FAF5799|nr:GDSL-type esterase/lipase family protein [Streptomyces sp. AP-93]MCJ0875812.1 GDSL-type esterase/lipase family protein [Streptomyces sp. AP-93]
MRFMFVGDSMTVGRAGDYTWRYRMWQHLETTFGGPYEIVGPRSGLYDALADAPASDAYADPGFPAEARRHLAGWGEGWQHMAPLIGPAVRSSGPDVLLVSLGLIDLGFYTAAEGTAENARRFIAEARAARPGIRMVLLPVIPNVRARDDAPFAQQVEMFNELLAKAVADLSTPASPILLAARPEAYAIDSDTYDGTHPNASGEHRLAGEFAAVLHQAWALGGPYRPRQDT